MGVVLTDAATLGERLGRLVFDRGRALFPDDCLANGLPQFEQGFRAGNALGGPA